MIRLTYKKWFTYFTKSINKNSSLLNDESPQSSETKNEGTKILHIPFNYLSSAKLQIFEAIDRGSPTTEDSALHKKVAKGIIAVLFFIPEFIFFSISKIPTSFPSKTVKEEELTPVSILEQPVLEQPLLEIKYDTSVNKPQHIPKPQPLEKEGLNLPKGLGFSGTKNSFEYCSTVTTLKKLSKNQFLHQVPHIATGRMKMRIIRLMNQIFKNHQPSDAYRKIIINIKDRTQDAKEDRELKPLVQETINVLHELKAIDIARKGFKKVVSNDKVIVSQTNALKYFDILPAVNDGDSYGVQLKTS